MGAAKVVSWFRGWARARWFISVFLIGVLAGGIGAGAYAYLPGRKTHEGRFELRIPVPTQPAGFDLALRQSLGVQMLAGNEVTLVENGAVFDVIEKDVRSAKSSVHVVLYIWEKGTASDRLVGALVERARAGVACRIVVDDFGSPAFGKDVRPALLEAGCDVRAFRPVLEGADELARNHRKLVIVDGKVGITGGFGARDNWLGDGVTNESWRDTSARFAGPVVSEAQQTFAENWQEAGGPLLPAEAFPPIAPAGPSIAAFVGSTAHPVVTRAERLEQLLIRAAKSRLWIANAYFIPSKAILEMLKEKAASGVDVRLLVPGTKNDSKTSLGAQNLQYGGLVEKGVHIWEYLPSMMHSKTMLVDDDLVLVGSVNLDLLSLGKLEEVALVAQDAEVAKTMAHTFEGDCKRGRVVAK